MRHFKQASGLSLPRGPVAILFLLTIINLVAMPLQSYFWLRENNGPALTPEVDYRARWISDADFRGLDQTGQSEYASEDGRTTYAAGKTWQTFRPFYVSTPDGQWHMMVLARGPMTPYAFRSYLGAAVPPLMFSIMGLLICLFGRRADSCSKARGPDRSSEELE